MGREGKLVSCGNGWND